MAVGMLLSVVGPVPSAFARSSMTAEVRWNAQHISQLPSEIRDAITRLCNQPSRAEHYFASYFQNSRLIKLHFEHFRCGDRTLCTQSGCLHQVYVLTGGHYRLLKTYHGPGND
jgi:hypothetical protein